MDTFADMLGDMIRLGRGFRKRSHAFMECYSGLRFDWRW